MKVADIRPDAVMVGQRAAMHADIDWLTARRAQFVHVACPACAADAPTALYDKYGMTQVRCSSCATQYVNPRPTPSLLATFYAQSENYAYWAKHIFPASNAARRVRLFKPRAEMVARLARARGVAGGIVVEVGAGYGQFCEEIIKTGAFSRVIAIEPTPDLAGVCRTAGVETIEAPYEEARIPAGVDVIACFEVIEHLFDPAAFLKWSRSALKPGGMVVLTCPNSAGFETLLLGARSGAVDHEHLNLFTPRSLALLAESSGFTSIEMSTPGRLDVDIVQRALADGSLKPAELGPVLASLVSNPDPAIADDLQALLRRAGLSSNMMMVARTS